MASVDTVLDRLAGVSQDRRAGTCQSFAALEVNGRIGAARATNFLRHGGVLFEEIGKQVEAAGVESCLSSRRSAPAMTATTGCAARESRLHVAAVRDAVAALV